MSEVALAREPLLICQSRDVTARVWRVNFDESTRDDVCIIPMARLDERDDRVHDALRFLVFHAFATPKCQGKMLVPDLLMFRLVSVITRSLLAYD
jgi:hypothetical protein